MILNVISQSTVANQNFIVNITFNNQTSSYVGDKTFGEIYQAFINGKTIVFQLDSSITYTYLNTRQFVLNNCKVTEDGNQTTIYQINAMAIGNQRPNRLAFFVGSGEAQNTGDYIWNTFDLESLEM